MARTEYDIEKPLRDEIQRLTNTLENSKLESQRLHTTIQQLREEVERPEGRRANRQRIA